jgi:hypothetical protein
LLPVPFTINRLEGAYGEAEIGKPVRRLPLTSPYAIQHHAPQDYLAAAAFWSSSR